MLLKAGSVSNGKLWCWTGCPNLPHVEFSERPQESNIGFSEVLFLL